MGLKRGWSRSVDSADVGYVLRAFEDMNEVQLVVELNLVRGSQKPDLWVRVIAITPGTADAAPAILDSVQSLYGSGTISTFESCVINALYRLDAQLDQAKSVKGMIK